MRDFEKPGSTLYILDERENEPLYLTLAEQLGIKVRFFSSVESLLGDTASERPDCLVLCWDAMRDGDRFTWASHGFLEVTQHKRFAEATRILIGTQMTETEAAFAIEGGAVAVLKKPLNLRLLGNHIIEALKINMQRLQIESRFTETMDALAELTDRQKIVLRHVCAGMPTKMISAELGVSKRLVELERSRLLKAFRATSTAEIALRYGEFRVMRLFKHRLQINELDKTRSQTENHARYSADHAVC